MLTSDVPPPSAEVQGSQRQRHSAEIVGWSLFAILDVVTRWTIYGDVDFALALSLVLTPLVILLASMMTKALDALGVEARLAARSLVVALPLCLLASLLMVWAGVLLRVWLGNSQTERAASEDILATAFYFFMIFLIYCLVQFWVRTEAARRVEEDRAIRAETEALRSELQRLRLQLNPHFLLNALNAIRETLERDPGQAAGVVEDLAVFLRHALDEGQATVTTVGEEVDVVSAYLGVQASRFGERLSTTLDVDVNALPRPIAGFLLQPLVENAVEHRVASEGARVSVKLRSCGETLRVEIRNPGQLDRPSSTVMGIGLANVRDRLALHYPARHCFDLREEAGDVVAVLTLEGVPCSVP